MSTVKKRFIAGAICPRCSKLDTIVMFNEDGTDIRECIDCDFTDKMDFKPIQREIETRVNVTEEEKKQKEAVQVIKFPSN